MRESDLMSKRERDRIVVPDIATVLVDKSRGRGLT